MLNPEARMNSLDAFKKSQELDKNAFTLYVTSDEYMPIFNLYTSGFEAGANLYNNPRNMMMRWQLLKIPALLGNIFFTGMGFV